MSDAEHELGLSGYCFFLPLPEPLPLEHGSVIKGWQHLASARATDALTQVRSSVKIHQVELDSSHDMAVIAGVEQFVGSRMRIRARRGV